MNGLNDLLYRIAGFISLNLWGRLSSSVQLAISAAFARIYKTHFSRFFIRPYCWWQYGDGNYYKRYLPGSGGETYKSFQDFFMRELPEYPRIKSNLVWPCEGYLCEVGKVRDLSLVKVKGEVRHIRAIFGEGGDLIPPDYYFANVFLHNNNYHHIHAPVTGTVLRIEHLPGELLLLRPWAYQKNPSLPALTNERYNVDLLDRKGQRWFLSIIGGPLVATIRLGQRFCVGADIEIGQKIASFELGSTCCMVGPYRPKAPAYKMVCMGDPF